MTKPSRGMPRVLVSIRTTNDGSILLARAYEQLPRRNVRLIAEREGFADFIERALRIGFAAGWSAPVPGGVRKP